MTLEHTIELLGRELRQAARVIAGHDRAQAADLYQEALIYLWERDPSRFAPEEVEHLRVVAVRRMIRLGRREAARHLNLLPIDSIDERFLWD